MQIRRLSRLAGGTCERLTVVSLDGVLRRTHFAKPPKKDIVDVTAMGKEVKYSYYLHFCCTQGQYIKITICKGPLTLIKAKLMGLATKDINTPCMHAEVRRFLCMALH